jgi:hypothetical protein
MIVKPLLQNPLGGGLGQIIPNPGAGIVDRFPGNPNRKPPTRPEQNPNAIRVPADPIMQGFQNSEFRKNANMMQQDAVNFKYKGEDRMMNSSMAGAFKQYLDSIGKGDLYEPEVQLSGPLQKVGIDDQLNATDPGPLGPPILDGTLSVNPIVTGPEELAIASNQQIPDAGLFNRVGQQMIGYDDQFSGINNRLNKIEEGITSLVQNRGQGLNMNTGGLGYFFNPFGGFNG